MSLCAPWSLFRRGDTAALTNHICARCQFYSASLGKVTGLRRHRTVKTEQARNRRVSPVAAVHNHSYVLFAARCPSNPRLIFETWRSRLLFLKSVYLETLQQLTVRNNSCSSQHSQGISCPFPIPKSHVCVYGTLSTVPIKLHNCVYGTLSAVPIKLHDCVYGTLSTVSIVTWLCLWEYINSSHKVTW